MARMRAVPPDELPYRDFYYPLNVFMHILTHEEGGVAYLHYGLFEREGEPIATAQERSTELLLERLPPPPASVLEAGIGLGTTLARLTDSGYDAVGITPDAKQIEMARARYGARLRIECSAFESFEPGRRFDCVLFQESSQYIDSTLLFRRAAGLTARVIVLDEFALRPLEQPGALHQRDEFLASADANGFRVTEELDLSQQAAPTVDYFLERIPRYSESLIHDLGLTPQQLDDLVSSGRAYRERYRDGTYAYRLLQFIRKV